MAAKRPASALVVVYCLFVFEQWAQAQHVFFVKYSWLTNVLAGSIVLLAVGIHFFRGSQYKSSWSFGALVIWLLFCYALLSVFWSENTDAGFSIWASKMPYLLLALIFVPWILRGTRDLLPVYQDFLIVGLILTALIYLTTDWTGRVVELGEGPEIAKGNPLEVATVAGLTMLVAIMHGKHGVFSIWGGIRVVAVLLGLIVAVRTGSRGQMIAAVVVVVPMLLLKNKMTSPRNIAATLLVGLTVLIILNVAINHYWSGARFSQDLAIHDMSLRFSMSGDMLAAWFGDHNPFTVFIGLGSTSAEELIGRYPHNVPIEILTEEGVIGFSLYLTMLIWLLVMTMKRLAQKGIAADERDSIYIASSIFLYFWVLTFKQGSMLSSHAFFMSGMVLAGLVWWGARGGRLEQTRHRRGP